MLGARQKLVLGFGGLLVIILIIDVGLIAQSGKEIDEPIFTHLFMNKKEAKGYGVYRLGINDLITVYGIVNGAYNKEPWIEVYVVKKGWE